ncbi:MULTISPECIES: MFS transporter [Pandoraea]|nr:MULTISPECIES: MFS transporter [Pandoraea]
METSIAHQANQRERVRSRKALRFVILIGILSFFADFTYEGSRSILGPFLLGLGASATVVGIVTGFGELLGYALRVASGRWADMSGKPWPITIIGYVVQMSAVPALALVHTWHWAAVLIVLERVGKAIRNPPRDVMLSYAASDIGGYGWAFGIHEALDQFGAMVGPLLVAVILALKGTYQLAFTVLLAPALVNVILVLIARSLYPVSLALQPSVDGDRGKALPREYWVYLAGASLVAAGFADYPLIAFHLSTSSHIGSEVIAALYASAMAVSGAGALVFGRLFDRFGFAVIVCLTLLSTLFAPMVFLGGSHVWWIGGLVWGIGMGFHESIIPAAVSPMAPPSARATAFGIFTAGYGMAWFAGSSAIGILYDASKTSAVIFCVSSQLLALPFFLWVWAKGAVAR